MFCFKEKHFSNVRKFLSSQVRTANIDNQGNRRTDDQSQEEEGGDLDFANFMTLDSVGEDGERKNIVVLSGWRFCGLCDGHNSYPNFLNIHKQCNLSPSNTYPKLFPQMRKVEDQSMRKSQEALT